MSASVSVCGRLPANSGIMRAELKRAAAFFAASSEKRIGGEPWHDVAVNLVDDEESARLNALIMGHDGPTDVITQRYDAIPGGPAGLSGELFVNTDCALREGARRARWNAALELLLYVAHGMDHLSGADDAAPSDRRRMRRRELGWIASFRRRRSSPVL